MIHPGHPLDGWNWRCPCGGQAQISYGYCHRCTHRGRLSKSRSNPLDWLRDRMAFRLGRDDTVPNTRGR
jgi:hypothetical protein